MRSECVDVTCHEVRNATANITLDHHYALFALFYLFLSLAPLLHSPQPVTHNAKTEGYSTATHQ